MADDKVLLVKIKGLDELTPVMMKAMASMEASANKLAQSVEKINPSLGNVKSGAEGLNTGLLNLTAGIGLMKMAVDVAAQAWAAISGEIGKAIDEALEAEQAENQLTGALVSQGLYLQKNIETLDRYIKLKEKETGVSGESIQKMIAMGVQMGLTVEQSMKMEEAARKLAAATGQDVMSAFTQMQGALNGQTRSLAKVVPEVKNFTEAQLKSGAAIELVNQALDAQYNLYQASFSASLAKAKNSLSNVYEAFGKIITQNPIVIRGIEAFATWMDKLATSVEQAGKWVEQHQDQIERFGRAFVQALTVGAVALGAWAIAAGVAAVATGGLTAALALIFSPITITIAAVGMLTAAFYKWPGLFDQIVGSFKIMVGYLLQGISWIAEKTAKLVSIFDKDLAASLESIAKGIDNYGKSWHIAGEANMAAGEAANKTADVAVVALTKEEKKLDDVLVKQNQVNAARKEGTKSYGGVNMGTQAKRDTAETNVSGRDQELKEFEQFLDNKRRLAVSKEQEQANEIAEVRMAALKGTNTTAEFEAQAAKEVEIQKAKQRELEMLRSTGIMSEAQYNQAKAANERQYEQQRLEAKFKFQQMELEQAQLHRQQIADALGQSEEGYQAKQALEQERWQLELDQKLERAEQAGATDMQIEQMREQANLEHLARMNNDREAYFQNEAAMLEASGNRWEANGARIRAEQVKHGSLMGAIRGVQQTQEYRGTQQFLTDLGTLRQGNSKKMFEVGKKAAVVQATVNTFMSATAAYAAMAGIPIVGPALGAIAAAAAIAAGIINIQKIQSQQFEGGQADEGMDSIPQSLAGKSFVLSQGERVVQPQANKDLTEFLNKEKGMDNKNGGSKGAVYNITLNYGGMGTAQDARNMAEILVKEIRSMSERGTPIISDKGVVKST